MATTWDAGTSLVTASGVLGTSGKPIRVFNMNLISTGTASVIQLKSGTGSGGTIFIQETGTISAGKTFDYGAHGHYFPSGCFITVDGNIVSAEISYSQG